MFLNLKHIFAPFAFVLFYYLTNYLLQTEYEEEHLWMHKRIKP